MVCCTRTRLPLHKVVSSPSAASDRKTTEKERLTAKASMKKATIFKEAPAVEGGRDASSPGMSPSAQLVLDGIQREDRTVAFSVAGDPGGIPVLFLYPAGGNRLMLQMIQRAAPAASKLRLICVNRPGKAGTTPAREAGPAAHATTVCEDIVAVLDHLNISRVSVLFMCAGTPFALLFAARFPDRITNQLIGFAAWVSPVDFGDARKLYKLGGSLPSWLISPIVGSCFASCGASVRWLPDSILVRTAELGLSEHEKKLFQQQFPDPLDFVELLRACCQESGGESADMSVLLSSLGDLDGSYSSVAASITLYHGQDDLLSPVDGAEWLAQQLPQATLSRLSSGTHEGVLRMLHGEFPAALQTFLA